MAEVPRSAFEHREDLVGRNELEHVSTLQVFSYEFADENKLFLKASRGDGHYWEPVFTGNSINLHIFSAEDHFARLSNSEQDFNRCVELLGSKLMLNTRLVPSARNSRNWMRFTARSHRRGDRRSGNPNPALWRALAGWSPRRAMPTLPGTETMRWTAIPRAAAGRSGTDS